MTAMPDIQIVVDCDVLQADGGTRTASICGGYVALHDALTRLMMTGKLRAHPLVEACAAISVGVVGGVPMLDLAYVEDSTAEVDMNVVMTSSGRFIEVQGTAEGAAFSRDELDSLLGLASSGISSILAMQAAVVADPPSPRVKIVLATGNPGKAAEIRLILSEHELVDRPEMDDPVEDGDTLLDNARIKARALVVANRAAGGGRRHRAGGRRARRRARRADGAVRGRGRHVRGQLAQAPGRARRA